ncbi:hypothetical protein BD309DRAFT_1077736 [Dichomitus squalens]|uniref:Uncharacterized protein n=1 Tax=Dichomitus squalens TaxID=114155 RepID=A0A4V2K5B9_9APHY|nr:hypothetical protein BD311DRAFT_869881 [Dichomitus squalens]TBU47733.1 hypothetical protein BD309DRAFT_1077736 [Dichomitus squalens]
MAVASFLLHLILRASGLGISLTAPSFTVNHAAHSRIRTIWRFANLYIFSSTGTPNSQFSLYHSSMRLLHTTTGHFVEVPDFTEAKYAILSHTWESSGEQTYQELKEIQKSYGPDGQPLAPAKPPSELSPLGDPISIVNPADTSSPPAPQQPSTPSVLVHSLDAATSSSHILSASQDEPDSPAREQVPAIWRDPRLSEKLSESINSMYIWYGDSDVCYAFLADVPPEDDIRANGSRFQTSRWFTRGWTLQELIAPRKLLFLSEDWREIGSKSYLSPLLHGFTGIDVDILLH